MGGKERLVKTDVEDVENRIVVDQASEFDFTYSAQKDPQLFRVNMRLVSTPGFGMLLSCSIHARKYQGLKKTRSMCP